jgi:hypothetical protein
MLAEDIFDDAATPPCTPAGDVLASADGRAEVEPGNGVAPLLRKQRLPEVIVGRLVGVVVLLRR